MTSIQSFIAFGLYLSFFGTLIGGIFAALNKNSLVQRVAQTVIIIALGTGAAASGVFLLNNLGPINILESNAAFLGKLMIDHLSAIFYFLINSIGLLAVLYGVKYLSNEKGLYTIGSVQLLTSLFIIGMQLVVLATTPLLFIFAWEIMSLSSFLLVIADWKTASIKPAIFYLIMTHLGVGGIIAGFLLLSGGSFATNFNQIAQTASTLPGGTLIAAFILLFFGFGSKAGLFPFHGWLPEAHPQAPSHISALMSGVMLKIAVYGMLRLVLFLLPALPLKIGIAVVVIGLFSAIFGVLYSIISTDIKKILAFSSIENLGLIFTMIGVSMVAKASNMEALANVALLTALFQSISHAFFKSGLFLSAGIAVQAFHTRNIEKMGGIAKRMPLFSGAALLLIITAAALPPSGAFISEWLLIQSIINNSALASSPVKILLLIVLVAIGFVAGLAVFSMVRFFGIAFLGEPRSAKLTTKTDPAVSLLIPVILLGIISFLLGSVAKPILQIISGGSNIETPLTFNPFVLMTIIAGTLFIIWLIRRASSDVKNERLYHTWDCGQPIDASMEYTGTAFAGPIRFFFRGILKARKQVAASPMIATNPWLIKKSITIEIKPIWDQYFYNPVVKSISFLSASLRSLQNGNIQFYIALIFITLIITAIVTL